MYSFSFLKKLNHIVQGAGYMKKTGYQAGLLTKKNLSVVLYATFAS